MNRTDASDQSIAWYRDGTSYFSVTESEIGTSTGHAAVDHRFFIILDLAMGGGFPNRVCRLHLPVQLDQPGCVDGRRLRGRLHHEEIVRPEHDEHQPSGG